MRVQPRLALRSVAMALNLTITPGVELGIDRLDCIDCCIIQRAKCLLHDNKPRHGETVFAMIVKNARNAVE